MRAARSSRAACSGSSAWHTAALTAIRRPPARTTSATFSGPIPPRANAGSDVSAVAARMKS